jgi:hypothetical protein
MPNRHYLHGWLLFATQKQCAYQNFERFPKHCNRPNGWGLAQVQQQPYFNGRTMEAILKQLTTEVGKDTTQNGNATLEWMHQ